MARSSVVSRSSIEKKSVPWEQARSRLRSGLGVATSAMAAPAALGISVVLIG
jgi:hypothetical protein